MNNEEKIISMLEDLKSDITGLKTEVCGMKSDISGLKTEMSQVRSIQDKQTEMLLYITELIKSVAKRTTELEKVTYGL